MEDRFAALEQRMSDLQSQLYHSQIKYQALRAVVTFVLPEILNAHGFTPEHLHDYKDTSVTTVLWGNIGGASPRLSDELTNAMSDEIEAIYGSLASGVASSQAIAAEMAGHTSDQHMGSAQSSFWASISTPSGE